MQARVSVAEITRVLELNDKNGGVEVPAVSTSVEIIARYVSRGCLLEQSAGQT